MRTVYVQELMRLPLGKQGENGAARIVWQGLVKRALHTIVAENNGEEEKC